MIPLFLDECRNIDFSGQRWLLLADPPLEGQENMDRDRALLKWAYSDANAFPILRFFQWKIPAVSIGFCQNIEQLDTNKCKQLGIPIVQRPTGGKAIYHHTEFTYSVTLPTAHFLAQSNVLTTYNKLSCALAYGLRELGIDVKLARGISRRGSANPSCFSSTSRYELVVNGRKLVGSAQRRKHRAVLQQGSIIVGPQYMLLAQLVSENSEEVRRELDQHSTFIGGIINPVPEYRTFVEAMTKGFGQFFETDTNRSW